MSSLESLHAIVDATNAIQVFFFFFLFSSPDATRPPAFAKGQRRAANSPYQPPSDAPSSRRARSGQPPWCCNPSPPSSQRMNVSNDCSRSPSPGKGFEEVRGQLLMGGELLMVVVMVVGLTISKNLVGGRDWSASLNDKGGFSLPPQSQPAIPHYYFLSAQPYSAHVSSRRIEVPHRQTLTSSSSISLFFFLLPNLR